MRILICLLLTILSVQCTRKTQSETKDTAQNRTMPIVGGRCEGCDLLYEGLPENLNAIDTSAGWHENGRKLIVTGTVYESDGQTPARDVIVYYWQTDDKGIYSAKDGMPEAAKRHGHIRGWMKTGPDGMYALYTIRPGAYPGSQNPEHIHIVIKEPELGEYYVDEWVFDNDPFLTPKMRKQHQNRGGSGILKIVPENGVQTAVHDIILGKNIPNYPK